MLSVDRLTGSSKAYDPHRNSPLSRSPPELNPTNIPSALNADVGTSRRAECDGNPETSPSSEIVRATRDPSLRGRILAEGNVNKTPRHYI